VVTNFIINRDYRVVFSYAYGTFNFTDAMDRRNHLLRDPAFRSDFKQIADFTDLDTIQLSGDEIERLAENQVFNPESRRACVVASGLNHGLCRMVHSYCEGKIKMAVNIEIFRILDEAIRWVDVPRDVVTEAFSELRSHHYRA